MGSWFSSSSGQEENIPVYGNNRNNQNMNQYEEGYTSESWEDEDRFEGEGGRRKKRQSRRKSKRSRRKSKRSHRASRK